MGGALGDLGMMAIAAAALIGGVVFAAGLPGALRFAGRLLSGDREARGCVWTLAGWGALLGGVCLACGGGWQALGCARAALEDEITSLAADEAEDATAPLVDRIDTAEAERDELRSRVDDLEAELEEQRARVDDLELRD